MSRFLRAPLVLAFLVCAGALQAETPWAGERGITQTTDQIMERQRSAPERPEYPRPKHARRDRAALPQNPSSPAVSQWPPRVEPAPMSSLAPLAAQTVGLTFQGPTLGQTGNSFPPDTMGVVGPTQFIVFLNGRIRSYSKATGVADAVLNVNPDVFFASVLTPVGGAVVFSYTSDPRIRYDRLTGRWILIIIDVPCTDGSCNTTAANRVLFAVSDGSTITGSTVWTFYQFQHDLVAPAGNTGEFADYPTLGVDANALYIGINMFGASFTGTAGFVVRKSSILSGGPILATAFRNLATSAGAGPYTPQGVDNFDPLATEGWFIGPDNASFGTLMLRRVTDPGGSPSISPNVSITVPMTRNPISVDHLGDTSATGNLDALDDRLFAAHYRNGRLWTAHNIAVDQTGAASTGAQRRTAVRWYELTGIPTASTPSVVQSGTVFDTAATVATARQFWIPSVMVSGQGHAVLGFTSAGTPYRINAATVGRLAGDALGAFQTPAALGDMSYTNSSTAYNPPGDTGASMGRRRWGDYTYTSLDPLDDMTMWTVQQFCQATNSYAVQVAKLVAPPPATPSGSIALLPTGAGQVVPVTGTSTNGSGFFDPGVDLAPPALPFMHISAQVLNAGTSTPASNITVDSVTYTNPTSITLNVTTTGATPGSYDLKIANPDGQTVTSGAFVGVTPVELRRFEAD